MRQYTGGKSVKLARMCDDKVRVASSGDVKFDMTSTHVSKQTFVEPIMVFCLFQIQRDEIDYPKLFQHSHLVDYPPKLQIKAEASPDCPSPKLHIEGLDKECGFDLIGVPVPCKKNNFAYAIFLSCGQ